MKEYHVIGVMSGSSLDGLDVCYASFRLQENTWAYDILLSETLEVPVDLAKNLRNSDKLSSLELFKLDVQYGEWIGRSLRSFISRQNIHPDLIGLHGHTVFHEPDEKVTVQIGSGLAVSHQTAVSVVDTFRAADLLKRGQGAPLVPAGEHYLLSDYTGFVNLGGITNIAVHGEQIKAWDVAPCNQIFNHFAQKLGHTYDKAGAIAGAGAYDADWFQRISTLEFFKRKPPKSLSNQWTENILRFPAPGPADALHTYSRFLADQLSKELLEHLPAASKVLFTGGGTFNDFLIRQIRDRLDQKLEVVIPSSDLINYKEALIFGFLGLLRVLGKANVFCSVTGANSDSISGTVHFSKSSRTF